MIPYQILFDDGREYTVMGDRVPCLGETLQFNGMEWWFVKEVITSVIIARTDNATQSRILVKLSKS